MKTAKQKIREAAGRSRTWVSVQAECSEPSAKLYELAGPDAVNERIAARLDAVYAQLEASAPAGAYVGASSQAHDAAHARAHA